MIARTIQLYRKAYSGLTPSAWMLSIVMLINRSGAMVLAFLTLYCKHLGFTTAQGGWVVGIYGLGAIAGAYFGGKLSDKWGFYNLQFTALFLGGILFMVLGQMSSYLSICICTFVLSMVNESFRPANAAAIAHYSTPQNRTQSFSLVRLAINLGWGVGIALGGLLASINYHLLFWVDGCTSMGAAIMLLLLLPRVSIAEQKKPGQNAAVIGSNDLPDRSATKDKAFLGFLFFLFLFALCFFQLFTTVPLYMKESLHLSEAQIGTVMSVNGVMIALVEMLLVYQLEGRKPYLYLICLGTLLMALAFMALNLPLSSGWWIAICAVFILTLAEMTAMPFMNSYYIGLSPHSRRGQYAGLYTMAWSAAQVIGSSAGALTAQHWGFANLWWMVALICLISAAGFYALLHNKLKWLR